MADKIRDLKDLRAARIEECTRLEKIDKAAARKRRGEYMAEARDLRAEKDLLFRDRLATISDGILADIDSGGFVWGLSQGKLARGKRTYRVAVDNRTYFAAKQVEASLGQLRYEGMPDRHAIARQLREALDGPLPRCVARLDIESYFESIPHARLVRSLRETRRVPSSVVTLVSGLLREFAAITGQARGVPRGVGMSSLLAEFYVRELNVRMRSHDGVLYFARYVDDMIVITGDEVSLTDAERQVRRLVEALGLRLNPAKTERRLSISKPWELSQSITFLGYEFRKDGGNSAVRMPRTVVNRYQERIEDAFHAWDRASPRTSGHDGLLLDRVRFLSGNLRLSGGRARAVTGAYFNQPALTDVEDLRGLDDFLRTHIDKRPALPHRLRTGLASCRFEEGFTDRTFYSMSPERLQRCVAVWRDA
ncbi:antiviral reverse transcriptase Drt3a [Demequina sp. NBRC 110054]|uniref:antiviral reverse transcriptase Drt3a n=1 Tax=Demequina sp. NBRC 110054 TaxID=1570343 RepID=UPI0013566800|nr:antiviral reverse transcriptase Drt3a [Demequina sp. NBRC 110054]